MNLLLSVFISPWQFFKESVPSPRVEFVLLDSLDDQSSDWQEFCLRPKSMSFLELIKTLFFNPTWNESVYVMDCAERLIVDPCDDDEKEIMQRIKKSLELKDGSYIQFRLVFVTKYGHLLQRDMLFTSQIVGAAL